jgi:methionyl-tRNA synthetase
MSPVTSVRTLLETLRVIARELQPFLPSTACELQTRLQVPALEVESKWNVLPTGARVRPGAPLFRRIGRISKLETKSMTRIRIAAGLVLGALAGAGCAASRPAAP